MKQLGLLDEPLPAPLLGLTYLPDFITADQELELISHIDTEPWLTDLKRRVQHYGWRYDYRARAVDETMRLRALPDWLAVLAKRLRAEGVFKKVPDQVIVNEYQPGQGISPHVDCEPCFGETIASLSLGSACVMNFMHSETKEKTSMLLEPRSLIVLGDEARYKWQHGIAPRKTDRYRGDIIPRSRRLSLTFRTVLV